MICRVHGFDAREGGAFRVSFTDGVSPPRRGLGKQERGPTRTAGGWRRAFDHEFSGLSQRLASAGEPFQSEFEPGRLSLHLRSLGFRKVEDVSGADLVVRYLSARFALGRANSAHVVKAATE